LGLSSGTGVTVTASATANTKGSYSTIGTTSFEYDAVWVTLQELVGGTGYRQRIDIAANTGGADEVIIADLFFDASTNGGAWYNTAAPFTFCVPVCVPAGAVLKARAQSSTGSGTVAVWLQGQQGDAKAVRGFRGLASATDWTNTDATGSCAFSGQTLSSWAQIQASTPNRFAGLMVGLDSGGTVPSGFQFLVDVGWGSSGSERKLFSLGSYFYFGGFSPLSVSLAGPFPCDLPAGSRLVGRVQSNYSSAAGAIKPLLYGLIA
jgi:hypothetical protein